MENPVDEPMSRLTHDLIAEILCRVPYKSLCICKCVCPAWRDLIADPANRKKMAQTLAGFFYCVIDETTAEFAGVNYADLSAFPWASLPRTYPRLPPPPDGTHYLSLVDSCDGLFLARIDMGTPPGNFCYMVSNPATTEYTVLPHSGYDVDFCGSYLGFDSDVSTEEFHVFEFILEQSRVVRGVNIYSSKSGAWVSMGSRWDIEISLPSGKPGVFRKGCLHLLTQFGSAIVDAQGLKWRIIPLPIFFKQTFSDSIGKSAGQLLYIDSDGLEGYSSNGFSTISVHVLRVEIYQRDVSDLDDGCMYWKLLHTLSNVAPKKMFLLCFDLNVVGVHPHANIIFFTVRSMNELIAYDLDHHESTAVYHIEPNYQKFKPFFSFVPLLSRLPLDGGIRLATPN